MQHVNLTESIAVAISGDERAFFVELGARIAELRRAQNITQVQVAEELGITQQTFNSYEVGRRRGPAPKLLRQVEQISRLPKTKQKFAMEMLDTIIQQAS